MRRPALLLAALLAAPLAAAAAPPPADEPAADGAVYAVLELSRLDFDDPPDSLDVPLFGHRLTQLARLVLPEGVEGFTYVATPPGAFSFTRTPEGLATNIPAARVGLRALAPVPVSGTLQLRLDADDDAPAGGVQQLAFHVPAEAFSADQRADWLRLRAAHHAQLVEQGVAGAAWFRHERDAMLRELGLEPDLVEAGEDGEPRDHTVADSFELLSGARAVSENLALHRRLPPAEAGVPTLPLSEIEGVEIPPYDWGPLVADLAPEVDPLARLIPHDQYALLLPDAPALLALTKHVQRLGAPVFQLLEPRAVDTRVIERLEVQLGLTRDVLARTLGPEVARGLALTGAGYELRTGSDLALLVHAVDVDVLHKLIATRVREAAGRVHGAQLTADTVLGTPYERLATDDRRLSAHLAVVGEAVVLTNSVDQLRRIVATHLGRRDSVASLPEYAFFRSRYPRGEPATAFALLSDATIRRWVGPRWRIGASRIARARAALLEVQARRLADLEAGVLSGSMHTPADLPELGRLSVADDMIHSDAWGSRDFATPVLELELDAATEEEAEHYARWRAAYERNWRDVFDPIAARLRLAGDRLELDLSVRPLVQDSDYGRMIAPVADGSLGPWAADPHADAWLHHAWAVDPESPPLRGASPVAMLRALTPDADPLGWMGGAVAVWADADPFWDELAAADDAADFLGAQLHRLPVALHADVRNGFALAAFLAGLRAMAEGSAPGMLAWETREHVGQPYVRVAPTPLALADAPVGDEGWPALREIALHYVASGEGLTLSLDEDVVRRALERQVARREARATASATGDGDGDTAGDDAAPGDTGDPAPAPPPAAAGAGDTAPWLGEHVALRVRVPTLLAVLDALPEALDSERSPRAVSWSNLTILDAWRALFPDEDPVALHLRLWGERLLCPGGGAYRWNADDRCMESSVYGHPGRPLPGPRLPPVLHTLERAAFGLTFEDDGLRARVIVESGR